MQIIKVKPGQVFILELDPSLSDGQKEALLKEWNKILPDNPVVMVAKGSLSILSTD